MLSEWNKVNHAMLFSRIGKQSQKNFRLAGLVGALRRDNPAGIPGLRPTTNVMAVNSGPQLRSNIFG